MSEKPKAVEQSHVALFQEKTIRRTWHDGQWWFAVADVVAVLTDSLDPGQYIKKMRTRDKELAQGWVQIVTPLRILTEGGAQNVNCATTEGLLRIIQSVSSPKAEPFKRWLAQVGYERIKEIEDPELASARARELYEAKGYPKDWIEKRMRSIAIRGELTGEWKQRGVKEGKEYAILTAEIAPEGPCLQRNAAAAAAAPDSPARCELVALRRYLRGRGGSRPNGRAPRAREVEGRAGDARRADRRLRGRAAL